VQRNWAKDAVQDTEGRHGQCTLAGTGLAECEAHRRLTRIFGAGRRAAALGPAKALTAGAWVRCRCTGTRNTLIQFAPSASDLCADPTILATSARIADYDWSFDCQVCSRRDGRTRPASPKPVRTVTFVLNARNGYGHAETVPVQWPTFGLATPDGTAVVCRKSSALSGWARSHIAMTIAHMRYRLEATWRFHGAFMISCLLAVRIRSRSCGPSYGDSSTPISTPSRRNAPIRDAILRIRQAGL